MERVTNKMKATELYFSVMLFTILLTFDAEKTFLRISVFGTIIQYFVNFLKRLLKVSGWNPRLQTFKWNYYSKTKKIVNARIISGMLLCWERRPIRYEMNDLQVVTVIKIVVCGFFLWFDRASYWSWQNEHSKLNNYWCSRFYQSHGNACFRRSSTCRTQPNRSH